MENAVRRKLKHAAGLDFAIIDMEHSPIDLGTAAHLVRTADAANLTPFLRRPGTDKESAEPWRARYRMQWARSA